MFFFFQLLITKVSFHVQDQPFFSLSLPAQIQCVTFAQIQSLLPLNYSGKHPHFNYVGTNSRIIGHSRNKQIIFESVYLIADHLGEFNTAEYIKKKKWYFLFIIYILFFFWTHRCCISGLIFFLLFKFKRSTFLLELTVSRRNSLNCREQSRVEALGIHFELWHNPLTFL